jgi:hypothetical protein
MALIEANRLTVTIPNGPDDQPDEALAAERIHAWLEQRYGYRPPVAQVEGHGWSDRWRVGGRTAPGWRFDAVIPRHLGPAPAADDARAHHPANRVQVPPVARSRSSATARAARRRAAEARGSRSGGCSPTRGAPDVAAGAGPAPGATLFPDLAPRPS